MQKLSEQEVSVRVWTPVKTVEHLGKPLVLHQWQPTKVTKPTEVLLTESDMNYTPTQEELKTTMFYASPELYEKLFKPKFQLRNVDKKKVA